MDVGGKVSQNMSFFQGSAPASYQHRKNVIIDGFFSFFLVTHTPISVHVNKLDPELPSSVDQRSKRLPFSLSLLSSLDSHS